MPMTAAKEQLEIMKKAQVLDKEIYDAQVALEEIPQQKEQVKSEFEAEKAHLRELEETLKQTQLAQKNKEGELAEKENNIKKLDGQLGQVKTNKEYSALQQEIASLKADNSILEEEIIKMIDQVEAAEEEVKKEQERLKDLEAKFKEKENQLSAKEAEAKGKVDGLKKESQSIIDQLEPESKELYGRIVSKKQGIALATIHNEMCSACHVLIRPQVINNVHLAADLVQCESCQRILYVEVESAES